jgi:hypothetical protein
LLESEDLLEIAVASRRKQAGLVGAVGIEIASLLSESTRANGVATAFIPIGAFLEPDEKKGLQAAAHGWILILLR